MIRLCFMLLLLLSCIRLHAHEHPGADIAIGHLDSLYSGTLREQRQLMIYLPHNYSPEKRYPVCYLLDAESHFHMFTGIVQHLGNNAIPELIVVGIVNGNRNRDYTPTHDPGNYDTANGHGEAFTAFLQHELIPYIDKHYAAAPYRILAGHSLGGLLAINTLLQHPSLFKAYLAIDPSLWWDKMGLVKRSGPALQSAALIGTRLFMGLSAQFPTNSKAIAQALSDTATRTLDTRSVLLFRQQLEQSRNKGFQWRSKSYPDEAHGSVPLPAYYDGLRFVFDFYRRPSLNVLTDTTVQMLARHYEAVSRHMGYTILPPEEDLSGLAWRSAVLENNLERAYLYLQTYIRLYPQSPDAHQSIGEYFEQKGDTVKANQYYEKARSLSPASR